MEANDLIPPPRVVRQRLAVNIRERRLLRSLLRLSVRATEDARLADPTPRPESHREEGGRNG